MKKTPARIIVLSVIALLVAGFFFLDLGQYASLDYIKSQQQHFNHYYQQHPVYTVGVYVAVYVLVTALSIPGATVLTLLGGALFGLWTGTMIVSFASTTGAACAFLIARFVAADYFQNKYRHAFEKINAGVAREGAFYLLTLRLIPVVPFFVVNMLMGLTRMRVGMFFIVSQIGMFPATLVYVYAGRQLGQIDSLSGIISGPVLFSLALLGIFPLVAKKTVDAMRAAKVMRRFKKPKRFNYNMVVIGAGAGGLVVSYIAAAVKARVVLIEKHKMGGDCLNTGCVPSKALIRSAKMLSYAVRAKEFGFKKTTVEYEFTDVMKRVRKVIQKIEPHDSAERYTRLGVECISGEAMVVDPYRVKVNGKMLTTRSIVVASGARPLVPEIPGLEKIDYLTSDTVWSLKTPPKRLLVLGGGPIGCELAQAFARFGAQVTLVEMAAQILVREDAEVQDLVAGRFKKEGVKLLTDHKAVEFVKKGRGKQLICEHQGKKIAVPFDEVLIALGRKANVTGFGLEELGVSLTGSGNIEADSYLRTNYPNIYVCGDVTGPYQFTHVAAHQAWYAAANALFSPFKKFAVDYRVIPWATFTDPEVARVGLNEKEAKERGVAYEVTRYGIDDLDRAIADSEGYGLIKVLTVPGRDVILGVTIVGHRASDVIAEFVLAMKHGIGLNKLLGAIHVYPTMAEANKYVAGQWRKGHAPQRMLKLLQWFHAVRRG